MDIDQDLQDALGKLKNDGVEIQIVEPGKGDQKIIIETVHYTVQLGANDIGVWLEECKKRGKGEFVGECLRKTLTAAFIGGILKCRIMNQESRIRNKCNANQELGIRNYGLKKLIPFLIHNSIFLILAVTIYILLPAPPVQAGCCERNSGPDTSCCSEINEDACSSPGSNYVSMSCAAYRTASETDCPTCPPTGPTTGGCCISQATAGATASCVYDFYTTTGCVDLHASDYYKTWHPNDECSLFQICPQSVPSSTGCITATRCPTGKTQGDGPCPEGQIVCVPDSSTPPTSAPLKLPNPLGTDSVPKIVGRIIKILTGGAGMIAFLMFVYGGFQWLTAMGNPEKIKKGKDIILWSILGLVVMMSAYIVTNYIIKALLPAAF